MSTESPFIGEVQKTNEPAKPDEPEKQESINWVKWIAYGFIIGLIIAAIWYASTVWLNNTATQEPLKNKKEKDEHVDDYDLREAVQRLKKLQSNILSQLSEAVD